MPQACIVAYAVTGPVKVKPWRLSSALSALAAGVVAGTSASVRGAAAGSAAYFQTSALSPSGRSSAARALTSTALILARFRTMPASASRRSRSASPKAATAARSNPAKAARKFSRLRKMVSQDSPDWKPSRHSRSKIWLSPRTGRPHSWSW
jgi:hypothetical protein